MLSHRNNKPSDDGAPIIVSAPTLKDAYKIVRRDHGPDAVILGSRTVNRRQELGLGHDRRIEVTVQAGGAGEVAGAGAPNQRVAPGRSVKRDRSVAAGTHDLNREIMREVDRIEDLVASIAEDHDRLARRRLPFCTGPLAEKLVANGASPETVNTLLTRFASETGKAVDDQSATVAWLTENLRASNCTWDEFYGCHAFLGEAGSGRTDLVLAAAGLVQGLGRRTLVLSVMPGDNGAIKRLQVEAAAHGFDAAVIKKESQLASAEKHLSAYDVVLVDMPHLQHEAMAESGPVHAWLARNAGFHRHLLVPMDKDPRDMEALQGAARIWNCDWVTITRTDLSARGAKLLDMLERLAAPISLWSANPMHGGSLEIAHSDRILDSMTNSESAGGFEPGLQTTHVGHAAKVAE